MVEQWIKDANDAIKILAEVAYDDLAREADIQNIELYYAVEVFKREFNNAYNNRGNINE